jgi:hypothetical protein
MISPLLLSLATAVSAPPTQDEMLWDGAHGAPHVRGHLLPDGAVAPGTPGAAAPSGVGAGPAPGTRLPPRGPDPGAPGGSAGGSAGGSSQPEVPFVALPFAAPRSFALSPTGTDDPSVGTDGPGPTDDPGQGGPPAEGVTTPEPSSVVLLVGLGIGGAAAQRVKSNRRRR